MKRLLRTSFCIFWLGLLLLSGYGGLLAPSRFGALPAILVLAYPVVSVLSLSLVVFLLLLRKWRMAVTILVVQLATWPSIHSNFPVNVSRPVTDSTRCFTVMNYNVAGFNDRLWDDTTQMHPAMRLILDEDADFVILLQPVDRGLGYDERKSIEPWIDEIERHYPYRTHSRYDHVELLSKHPFRAVPLSLPIHDYRYFPYVIKSTERYAFDIALPNSRQLRIVGAHLTSYELNVEQRHILDTTRIKASKLPALYQRMSKAFVKRERASKQLRDSLDASPANVILCTDLNDVPQSYAYRTLIGNDLNDGFEECHTGYVSTFRDYYMLFHIDHILYRGSLRAIDYKRIASSASDHDPIVTRFEWQ